MRQKMAEDMSEDELTEFMSRAQIPVKFKPVVQRLKRKQGANTELYRHAKNKIGKLEWKSFWGQVKKGTAPGKSGVTTDMVFRLRVLELDVIRRLVNLVLEEGLSVYKQWKRRIITPVPKEEGNFSVERARPLVLLEVLQKAFWAIMTARMTRVWEERRLLNDMQFGFRKGRSVTAPGLMATLIQKSG